MVELINLRNKDKVDLIKDVFLYPLKVNKDESGILIETLRTDWKEIYGKEREFFMQYFSITKSGIARDENIWHSHPVVQEDRFLIVSGAITVAIADKREESPTNGVLNLFHMESEIDPYILLIPKRTLHGFLVVSKEPGILLNFPTALYNPKEEDRVPFDTAGIKFPDGSFFNWDVIRELFNTNE